MFNYASNEQFQFLKTRWEKTNLSKIDERILESVIQFGSLEGVVPVWSCSGHTVSEQIKKRGKFIMPQERYICFAVAQGHTSIFRNLEEWQQELNRNIYLKIRPVISTLPLNLNNQLHPYWKICFRYKLDGNNGGNDPDYLEHYWNNFINYLILK